MDPRARPTRISPLDHRRSTNGRRITRCAWPESSPTASWQELGIAIYQRLARASDEVESQIPLAAREM